MALSRLALAVCLLLCLGSSPANGLRPGQFLSYLQLPALLKSDSSEKCGPSLSIETPSCEVLDSTASYELREYPAGQMWAQTLVASTNYSAAIVTGFYRCFNYISGQNDKDATIEMTAPVLIKPIPKEKGWSISFFVPSEFDTSSVPQPNNEAVKIVQQKESVTRAVLKPFGGFPNDKIYAEKWEDLKALLKADGVNFHEASVVYAGYSSPFTFINRQQEVWVDVSM